MPITSVAALVASLALTPIAVSAEETSSQVIHFHMDDLDTEAGWNAVEERIRTATDRVCRPHGLRGLVAERIRRACFDATYGDAMAQLNRQYAEASSRSVAVVITAR